MEQRFETFTVLINKINRNIRKIKNLEMAQYNLRSVHISCLYYLYAQNGLTATELCERCQEDKATISRAIEYLEKNGYVSCLSKTAKRYKSTIELTEKGEPVAKKIADKILSVLNEINDGLSDSERREFYRCLNIISESLDKAAEKREKEQ